VWLDASACLRAELVTEVDREVGGLVPVAVNRERHDRDRRLCGVAPRRRRGLRGDLRVRQAGGDPLDPVHLRANGGGARSLAAREHNREVVPLRALETHDVLAHDLRLRAGHLEPAAREVLGLPRRERQGGEQKEKPGNEDEPATPLEKPCKSVHRPLHPVGDTQDRVRFL
jgi:hypothetical protein